LDTGRQQELEALDKKIETAGSAGVSLELIEESFFFKPALVAPAEDVFRPI
jgi:hypothetical protein